MHLAATYITDILRNVSLSRTIIRTQNKCYKKSMGSLVTMPVYIYLHMCQCMCLCVDMYMCMNMIVSCMFIYCVCYDYVQHCEDTISVKMCYIN